LPSTCGQIQHHDKSVGNGGGGAHRKSQRRHANNACPSPSFRVEVNLGCW
jgi:hypothetical protein